MRPNNCNVEFKQTFIWIYSNNYIKFIRSSSAFVLLFPRLQLAFQWCTFARSVHDKTKHE
jgi:hypothetical protein